MLPPCHVPATAAVTTGADWQQEHPTWLHRGICAKWLVEGAAGRRLGADRVVVARAEGPGHTLPAPRATSLPSVGEFIGYRVDMTASLFGPGARLPAGELFDQDIAMFDDPLTKPMDASPDWAVVAASTRPGSATRPTARSGSSCPTSSCSDYEADDAAL